MRNPFVAIRIFHIGCIFIFLIPLVLLVGCGRVNLEWKEEVRLSNGQLITIERTAHGALYRELGEGTGWKVNRETLVIPRTETGSVPPPWRSDLRPIVLDYDPASSTWTVVATYVWCDRWYAMGRPASHYIEYVSTRGEAWHVIPLETSRAGQPANLLPVIKHIGEPIFVDEIYKESVRKRAPAQFKEITPSFKSNC